MFQHLDNMSKKMSYAESFDIAPMLSWTAGLNEDLKDTEYPGNIMYPMWRRFNRSGRFKSES